MSLFNIPILSWLDISGGFFGVLWKIATSALQLIETIIKVFYFLVGIGDVTIGDQDFNILQLLFGFSIAEDGKMSFSFNSTPIHKAYFMMLVLFAILLALCVILSFAKMHLNKELKEVTKSRNQILVEIIKATALVILMPIIFVISIAFFGIITDFIITALNVSLNEADSNSIVQTIINASNGSGYYLDVTKKWSDVYSDHVHYDQINWIILLGGTACILVGITLATLTVTERIIWILFAYLIAPLVCATIPLNDGKMFEAWKDFTITKIVSVLGNILTLLIYVFLLSFLGEFLLNSDEFLLKLIYVFVAAAGAFVAAKGSIPLAGIISSAQGQAEAMSGNSSAQMLGMAAGVAGKAVAAAGFLAGRTSGTGSTLANGLLGGSDGNSSNAYSSSDTAGVNAMNNATNGSLSFNQQWRQGVDKVFAGARGGVAKTVNFAKNSLTVPGMIKNVGSLYTGTVTAVQKGNAARKELIRRAKGAYR